MSACILSMALSESTFLRAPFVYLCTCLSVCHPPMAMNLESEQAYLCEPSCRGFANAMSGAMRQAGLSAAFFEPSFPKPFDVKGFPNWVTRMSALRMVMRQEFAVAR